MQALQFQFPKSDVCIINIPAQNHILTAHFQSKAPALFTDENH